MMKICIEFTPADLEENLALRSLLASLAEKPKIVESAAIDNLEKPIDARYIANCETWEETAIDKIGISQRCSHILGIYNITTLGQLVEYTEEELLQVFGLSADSLAQINKRLKELGLSLKKV